jgi:hypothetical protein
MSNEENLSIIIDLINSEDPQDIVDFAIKYEIVLKPEDKNTLILLLEQYVKTKTSNNQEIKLEDLQTLVREYISYYRDINSLPSPELRILLRPADILLLKLVQDEKTRTMMYSNNKKLEEAKKQLQNKTKEDLDKAVKELEEEKNSNIELLRLYSQDLLKELKDILYEFIRNTVPEYYKNEIIDLREMANALIAENASRFDPSNILRNEAIIKDLLTIMSHRIDNTLIMIIRSILEEDDILDENTKNKILEIITNTTENYNVVILFNEFIKLLNSFRILSLEKSVNSRRLLVPVKSFPLLEDIANILANFLGDNFGQGNIIDNSKKDNINDILSNMDRIVDNMQNEVDNANSNIGLDLSLIHI